MSNVETSEESTEEEIDIEFSAEEPEIRLVGLYGDVNEEISKEAIGALLIYMHEARAVEDPEPIEMVVSTGGGNVADMFAVYDIMRMTRELCDISTLGIGKVMSAGVLILASGTKGQRRIGKHCRIMLHHVLTSDQGSIVNVRETCKEAEAMEELMFEALAAESNLNRRQIKKILRDNTDKFFSAEEAVEMGIADIIV
jgi:ATP-dependent Clp protease protease subunit